MVDVIRSTDIRPLLWLNGHWHPENGRRWIVYLYRTLSQIDYFLRPGGGQWALSSDSKLYHRIYYCFLSGRSSLAQLTCTSLSLALDWRSIQSAWCSYPQLITPIHQNNEKRQRSLPTGWLFRIGIENLKEDARRDFILCRYLSYMPFCAKIG